MINTSPSSDDTVLALHIFQALKALDAHHHGGLCYHLMEEMLRRMAPEKSVSLSPE